MHILIQQKLITFFRSLQHTFFFGLCLKSPQAAFVICLIFLEVSNQWKTLLLFLPSAFLPLSINYCRRALSIFSMRFFKHREINLLSNIVRVLYLFTPFIVPSSETGKQIYSKYLQKMTSEIKHFTYQDKKSLQWLELWCFILCTPAHTTGPALSFLSREFRW